MIALIILIVAAGMGGLIYEAARRMERASDPLTRRELLKLARPDLCLVTEPVDITEQTRKEVQETSMHNRTYWSGYSGTYCELCYWGTDLLDDEGAAAWHAHCAKAHAYVLERVLPGGVVPSEPFARTTEGTVHG